MLFRSTPCPNVKHSEEWGEPANCEAGDNCQYCHTRTEQQFHPEIYKSTKCNDVQQAGYCPRSVFCAFAHVERKWYTVSISICVLFNQINEPFIFRNILAYGITEESQHRELDGPSANIALSDIISNALPPDGKKELNNVREVFCFFVCFHFNYKDFTYINYIFVSHEKWTFQALHNGSNESCESASTSSLGSNNSHNNTNKAPGAQLQNKSSIFHNSLSNNGNSKATSIAGGNSNSTLSGFPDFSPDLTKQVSLNLFSFRIRLIKSRIWTKGYFLFWLIGWYMHLGNL